MLIVGESLNGTIPKVGEAIKAKDAEFVRKLALDQVEAGAQMLDVNAGVAGASEAEDLAWLVGLVQETVSVPLLIDSADPAALEAALAIHKGRPMINSISAEKHKLDSVLPLVASHDCSVVALCLGDEGIPQTPEARLKVARITVERAQAAGVKLEDIYVDPLTLGMCTSDKAAKITLETLRLIRQELPGVRIMCIASNVSFGMPNRRLLNRTFAAMAVAAAMGVEAVMVDVRDKAMMSSLMAADALAGRDPYCKAYFKAFRAGKLVT
ncbi:MAG: dihydropteroate synthase [Dehalococcoidia bacterium]|nr:dihydropteroate synthase [Dehalococcoidia bacterium]